ncbi:hypothetical protein [Chryseolinea soli]|uniref:hypothetical protein n=1 Tax=Chryseolinea soli TaxID=2321403 RepID=UPI00135B82A6|nr:hypothetical protein [Chryseolinea soli]
MPLKRMIVMKLCGNLAYGDFADMFEKRMLAAVERGRKECESYYAAVGVLKT